jgi:DNA-directed RNA polymerase subunit M/transcription elongation factor TFIIS/ketosteroid isomerase-like protein
MVICPKCSIEYDAGKKFCRKCGSFLLTDDEAPSGLEGWDPTDEVKTKAKLICPKCQALYEMGNYCRRCGSLLVQRVVSHGVEVRPLERKSIKKWSRQWLRLFEEKKKLEICLSKLEAQRDRVSSNILNPLLTRYREQLESLSTLHQEIETELESVKKRVSEEIDLLERELQPIQKRLAEVQSLYQSGAMTKADFSREKNEMVRQIGLRETSLAKHRHILSTLPNKLGGGMVSHTFAGNFLQPFPLTITAGFILFAAILGYFFWQTPSSSNTPLPKEMASPSTEALLPQNQAPVFRDEEAEKIRSLFENIRQANLKKNIGLLMSCYARDFKDKEGKRLAALETWENFNYLDLSYQFKKQKITGDTADIKVEWLIRTSPKAGGKPQDSRTVLNVTLSREQGNWKIRDIQSVS